MQIQPSINYNLVFASFELPSEFPVLVLRDSVVNDTPVTFLHHHNCFEIGLCHEGSGIFIIGDKVLPFAGGDVSIIGPNEPHLGQATPGTKSRWTWLLLDPDLLLGSILNGDIARIQNIGNQNFAGVLKPETAPEIVRITECLVTELQAQKASYATVARGLVLALFSKLGQDYPGTRHEKPDSKRSFSRITPALNLMMRQYMKSISMEQLAGTCNMSLTYFRRLFHSAIGKPPLEYLNSYRVQVADMLLQKTEKSILEISLDVGYPSLSSFNRQFKQHFGTTPRQRRKAGLEQ